MRSVAAAGETPSPSPTCNSIFIPFCFASKTHKGQCYRYFVNAFISWLTFVCTEMYQKTAEKKARYERGNTWHSCSCQRPYKHPYSQNCPASASQSITFHRIESEHCHLFCRHRSVKNDCIFLVWWARELLSTSTSSHVWFVAAIPWAMITRHWVHHGPHYEIQINFRTSSWFVKYFLLHHQAKKAKKKNCRKNNIGSIAKFYMGYWFLLAWKACS